ncbi:hypothetical protein ACFE04_005339 [Oxalis oulophora]
MASSYMNKIWVSAIALIFISSLTSKLGKSDVDLPYDPASAYGDISQTGNRNEEGSQIGYNTYEQPEEDIPIEGAEHDPAQIVAKALLCFNDKYIYQSCEESYRLSATGELNVPHSYVDQFCEGPCLQETHLVLNCIQNVLDNFIFYNRATIHDIKDTVEAGCGYGPERGNFNVAEHLEAEGSAGQMAPTQILPGISLMILACVLLI